MLFSVLYGSAQDTERPNFLLVVCDDLNLMGLGSIAHPSLHTPNIDSLVSQSYVFTNAHANIAGCGPSRASMFSGVLPQTSGHSGYRMSENSWLDNPILAPTTSVFKQFLDNGYQVYGSGKNYHGLRYREEDFTEYYADPVHGPYASNNRIHSDLPESFEHFGTSFSWLENIPSYPEYTGWQNPNGSPFFFESDENRDLMGDEMTVNYCRETIESFAASDSSEPFFISAGLFNPHQPFHVPQKYWDLYEPSTFDLEFFRPDNTIPTLTALTNRYNAQSNKAIDPLIQESPSDDPEHYLRQYIHGYYASVSFVDDQIGALLEALEENGLSDNTIVIITSDHGLHLGSKGLLNKSTLWNDATAVPLIVKVPGEAAQIINEPVSLVDLYPTLLRFADIPEPESHSLDGQPLQDVISGVKTGSAILNCISKEEMELGETSKVAHSHHAFLKGRFKYIIYSSGEDELYDVATDFRETNDMSEDPQFQELRNTMHHLLGQEIGYIRPPAPQYECLYYGDFEQELNGWNPSVPSSEIGLIKNHPLLESNHVVLSGNSTEVLTNRNAVFRQAGTHELSLEGFSGSDSGELLIRISSEDATYLDTFLIMQEELMEYSLSFEVSEELPEFEELKIQLQSSCAFDIHLDNIAIRNLEIQNESLLPCISAESLQTDKPLHQLENKEFSLLLNQDAIDCEEISGNASQLWQKFSPEGSSGIIGVRIPNFDPVLEVYSSCSASEGPLFCYNERNDPNELVYLSDLIQGSEYYLRITSAKNLPWNNPFAADIKSLFINAKPAELSVQDFEVINQNGSLNLLNQVAFNYPITAFEFFFENLFSGETFNVALDFDPNLEYPITLFSDLVAGEFYTVSVRYNMDIIDVEIPFGPQKTFVYLPVSFIANDFVVFPNPIGTDASTLNLQFDTIETGEGVVSIFDMTGRKVFSQPVTLQSHVLNVSGLTGLSQGTYVAAFETKNGKSSQELLFVH